MDAEPGRGSSRPQRPSDADDGPRWSPDPDEEGGVLPGETAKQRWERNFRDILQELRVAQTGVQILFAFLLTLAFSARFAGVDGFQKGVYVTALLAAAAAAALIIAPVAYHRVLFRRGRKPEIVRSAHRMASGGLAFLVVSMVFSVLLVTDLILPRAVAFVITSAIGAWFALLWGVLPWLRRREHSEEDAGD